VFPHRVVDRTHPLTNDINTRFDVPHSRWNAVTREQFVDAGLKILVESDCGYVHLATSVDGFRQVLFQGHPEYDIISLLKEYKREVILFINGKRKDYPPFPEHYFSDYVKAIFNEYRYRVLQYSQAEQLIAEFPEAAVIPHLHNSWRDSADAVVGNWIGLIYQVTNSDRKIPFMEGIDSENPLGIL